MQARGRNAWMRKAMLSSGGWPSSLPALGTSYTLTARPLSQILPDGASGGNQPLHSTHTHAASAPSPIQNLSNQIRLPHEGNFSLDTPQDLRGKCTCCMLSTVAGWVDS